MRRLSELDPAGLTSKVQQRGAKHRLLLAVYVLIGVAIGLGLAIGNVDLPGVSPWSIFTFSLGYYLAIAIHEGAHAVAARLNNFRLTAFSVRPLLVQRTADGWRWSRAKEKGAAGFVSATPNGTERLRERFAAIVMAGPVASLVTALICSLINVLGGEAVQLPLRETLWSITAFSLLPMLVFGNKNTVTDLRRLKILRNGGPSADRTVAQLVLSSLAIAGVRPRDWNPELVQTAVTGDATRDALAGATMRYSWLIDRHDIDGAEDQLVWLVENFFSAQWQLHAAVLLAYFRQDADAAHAWRNAAMKQPAGMPRYLRLMADASIAFLDRDFSAMQRAIDGVVSETGTMLNRGAAIAISENMLDLRTRAAAIQ